MPVMDRSVIDSPQRLGAARRAQILLPWAPMPVDRLAQFAARSVSAPICQITFVRQFDFTFAGGYGIWPDLRAEGRAPLTHSVCKYMVSAGNPVCSDDMLADDDVRIREHPLVRQYGVRSFLGAPLRDETGEPVGAITVLDTAARSWTAAQMLRIVDVAELLGPVSTAQDGAPLTVTALDSANLLHSMEEAFIAIDWNATVVGFNRAAQELLGWSSDEVCDRPIEDTLCPSYQREVMSELLSQMRLAPCKVRIHRDLRLRHQDGRTLRARTSLSTVHGAAGTVLCAFITPSDVHEGTET